MGVNAGRGEGGGCGVWVGFGVVGEMGFELGVGVGDRGLGVGYVV